MTHEHTSSIPGSERDTRNPREIIEEQIAWIERTKPLVSRVDWALLAACGVALRELRDAIPETRLTVYRGAP